MKDYKKSLIAISLSTIFATSFAGDYMAIIGVEESIAKKSGVIEKNITQWKDVGSEFNCTSWTPNVNTIDYGLTFEQSMDCSQNQERNKDIYTVYDTGAEVYEKTVTESQTITNNYTQDAIGTRNFKDTQRIGDWTSWINTNTHYDCDTWTPNVNTIDSGTTFTQTRNCKQDQERERNIYDVWADGTETLNSVEKETKTITEQESQSATGTKNIIESERAGSWGTWSDTGSHYDCDTWTPSPSTIDYGESFTQTRDCSQNQIRSRNVYDVWTDGSETLNRVETENQTISEQESQSAVGTKNFKDTERADPWSNWTDVNGHYDCGDWSPETNTINYGQSFTQTRSCKQDQTRNRDVYDVWADGTETLNRTETSNQTINENESRAATGSKNYITTTRTGSWSGWSDSGSQYDCGSWSPSTSTVNYGQSFTQSQSCKQNQTRSRTIYNVWANGTETVKTTETDAQTINETNNRTATGSKNYVTGTSYGSWSSWGDTGGHYSCGSYSPSTSTVNYGQSFTQTRSCKQNQTRSRTVYNNWADGSKTVKTTETDTQTINENESRSATGTKNYITGTSYGSWSGWVDTGGHYSCGSYSPDPSTVNYGQSFTQTRSCKQNQTRSRTVYNNWADGSKTVKTTETSAQTINENESRSATGTKNYVTHTSTGSWSSWSNSGGQYSCGSYSPDPSTVNYGQSFTQTQTCKQNQTRTQITYNHWANGTTTTKSTATQSQTINVNNTRSATGTKSTVTSTYYGSWSSWEYRGYHSQMSCDLYERERFKYRTWSDGRTEAYRVNWEEKCGSWTDSGEYDI
jgi:hypothetical protein